MPLTPDEKDALAGLERQLRGADPTLAAALARGPRPRHTRTLLVRQVAWLLGALLVLVGLAPVVANESGGAGIGIVTSLVIVPWLVVTVRVAARLHWAAPRPRARENGKRKSLS